MIDPVFSLDDAFPARTFDEWKRQAIADLRGESFEKLVARTYEGIELQPLYVRPFRRASRSDEAAAAPGVDLRMEVVHLDRELAREQIREDLNGGADSLCLRRRSYGMTMNDVSQLDDLLGDLLGDVDLARVAVVLDVDFEHGLAGSQLAALQKSRWNKSSPKRIAYGVDPLGAWAERSDPGRTAPAGDLTLLRSYVETFDFPGASSSLAGVHSSAYHHAGATDEQELGIALATAVAYLREMIDAGWPAAVACHQIEFTLCTSESFFLSIAKLRAARRLWRRVLDVCNCSAPMRLTARVSRRCFSRRQVHLNLVRNAAACFAAIVGGADAVIPAPYDARLVESRPDARRLARNTVLILAQEAGLIAPAARAAESWFLNAYAEELAQAAWSFFQEIERRRGMAGVLADGWLSDRVAASHEKQAADFASGKLAIVGVNLFQENQLEITSDPQAAQDARAAAFPDRPLA